METNVFPMLTGSFQVGITHEEFWFEEREPARLPVTIFYPADVKKDGVKEKYAFKEAVYGLPISEMNTAFFTDAPAAGEKEKYPVIIFNHGYGSYEMSGSVLCGELASRGYIVASLGHTREATAVKFKDGTVILMDERLKAETHEPGKEARLLEILKEIKATPDCDENEEFFIEKGKEFRDIHEKNERMAVWTEKKKKALDYLEAYNSLDGKILAGRMNLERGAALMGHSFGGAAAAPACREDDRFCCGINIDGADLEYDYGKDIGKPFMTIGTPVTTKLLRGIYNSNQADTYRVSVGNVEHMGFTDLAFFPETAAALKIPLGERRAEDTLKILVKYLDLFLKKYLLGEETAEEEAGVKETEIKETEMEDVVLCCRKGVR